MGFLRGNIWRVSIKPDYHYRVRQRKFDSEDEEPTLVFLRDETASIPQPIKEPAALGRASLPKRTAQTVTLTIEEELSFTNAAMEKRTETGWFTVTVGSESARIFVNEE